MRDIDPPISTYDFMGHWTFTRRRNTVTISHKDGVYCMSMTLEQWMEIAAVMGLGLPVEQIGFVVSDDDLLNAG